VTLVSSGIVFAPFAYDRLYVFAPPLVVFVIAVGHARSSL
jgi:hypothetical protein